jgi:hypothetical protein
MHLLHGAQFFQKIKVEGTHITYNVIIMNKNSVYQECFITFWMRLLSTQTT